MPLAWYDLQDVLVATTNGVLDGPVEQEPHEGPDVCVHGPVYGIQCVPVGLSGALHPVTDLLCHPGFA